jgi:PIN domain nuclease of toxin-antitoxin system
MRLLLDTHIFLWHITNNPQLPELWRASIEDEANDVFLSVVSHWEIAIKYHLGRLPLPSSPESYIPAQRRLHQIYSLPLNEQSVQQIVQLPPVHRDPFDRILIYQALAHQLTIVTLDHLFSAYPVSLLK